MHLIGGVRQQGALFASTTSPATPLKAFLGERSRLQPFVIFTCIINRRQQFCLPCSQQVWEHAVVQFQFIAGSSNILLGSRRLQLTAHRGRSTRNLVVAALGGAESMMQLTSVPWATIAGSLAAGVGVAAFVDARRKSK